MYISNLIIETTRRCNMSCPHCLRGDAENCDMEKKYVIDLLSQVDEIGLITFTGGEPSLNVDIIEFTLEECKRNNTYVGSFYIATNGLKVKEDFVISCLKWYAYCEEKEMCIVQVSNDEYHCEDSYNTELLDGLSFFSRKNSEEYASYNLINEGRAKDNYSCDRDNEATDIETVDDFNDTEIYLNCNGDIVNGCDWSYESQKENVLCKVNDLTNYYNTLSEE